MMLLLFGGTTPQMPTTPLASWLIDATTKFLGWDECHTVKLEIFLMWSTGCTWFLEVSRGHGRGLSFTLDLIDSFSQFHRWSILCLGSIDDPPSRVWPCLWDLASLWDPRCACAWHACVFVTLASACLWVAPHTSGMLSCTSPCPLHRSMLWPMLYLGAQFGPHK